MYEYSDGLRSTSRRPRLYLAKADEVRKFDGGNIDGFCAVVAEQYKKNGRWSGTNYSLNLAPGVRPLFFLSPLHGTWGDDLPSWGAVAERLGLSVESAQAVVRREYPSTGRRLDKAEAFALDIEASGIETETVIVSFGSPTRRRETAAFWTEPKKGLTSTGGEVIVRPGDGADWDNPEVVAPDGAKIVSSRHSPGMHGGYWTIEVIVPVEVNP